ncbi:glycosyl hydrolase family 76 domain-containing protein [Sarocladium implicatum]|nr:glycosyl hydrolase family 76 domain-containing protein [Sarocladium implicatum]
MPGGSWFKLLSRAALFVKSVKPEPDTGGSNNNWGGGFFNNSGNATLRSDIYTKQAQAGIETLNEEWYNIDTGIWDKAWWNSGNAFTVLADFALLRPEAANEINVGGYMRNTFIRAQTVVVHTTKETDDKGAVTSYSTFSGIGTGPPRNEKTGHWGKNTWDRRRVNKRQFAQFRNEFYDDMGWWTLGLIRAYDVTRDTAYLDSAVLLYNDIKTALGGPCKGGVYWSRERKYVNAITNELYLSIAASLANRIPSNPGYLKTAKEQWNWFNNSGMINKNNLINDGLNGKCKNNGANTWSYNQGVILGGLTELHRATNGSDDTLIPAAKAIARAAIKHLSNEDGVLVETDKCELRSGNCGRDGQQFKGIFVRNLRYLHEEAPEEEFRRFILDQAASIWVNNRDKKASAKGKSRLGVAWAGPFVRATGASQSCALDALVAAIAVA